MAAVIEQATPTLVAVPYTHRLRCEGCHRFVGTVGTAEVSCTRCGTFFVLDLDGTYVEVY